MSSRRVVLVAGPPAAGKSSYIAAHRGPDDDVLDFDAICRELGSKERHNHPPPVMRQAARIRAEREQQIAEKTTGTSWVIRTVPHPFERHLVAEGIGATEVLVLATPAAVAKQRAAADNRPAWTAAAIDKWWKQYRPSPDPRERRITGDDQ
ncbi:MAG TPA: hypothetical protein VFV01_06960 [Spirillospora sp.]|nr:hypothetical protein [Spirillospora sp.]